MLGKTMIDLGLTGRHVIPPPGGWQQHTYYIVDVAWHTSNPIHRNILKVGFLSEGPDPLRGAYTALVCDSDPEFRVPCLTRYLKAIAPIKGIGALKEEL